MDIHRPKPWRGWREYLKEVGTIVLGVLIALGAEQTVAYVNHRAGEAEARAAIEGEMGRNISYLRLREQKQRACGLARVAELQRRLDRYLDGKPWEQPKWIGRPTSWTIEDTRWQATTKGGLAALLPAKEIERYSFTQSRIAAVQPEEVAEQADWAELRALESLSRLNLHLAARFEVVLRDAAYRGFRVSLLTRQLEAEAKRIDLRIPDTTRPQSNSICYPIDTTREEALRLTKAAGYPWGEP